MADHIQQLRQTLKQHGQSLTASRKLVFEKLQHQEPQSMAAIIAACQGQTDRASVYRTIDLFERLGIVHRLPIGWKYKLELTDAYSHHHHHLTCNHCGRIIPLTEDVILEEQLQALAEAQGFRPDSHQLEIRGLCADCQVAKL